jgi:hypothetical protein
MSGSLPGLFAKCVCSGECICAYFLHLTMADVVMELGAWIALQKTRVIGLSVLAFGFLSFLYIWLIQ